MRVLAVPTLMLVCAIISAVATPPDPQAWAHSHGGPGPFETCASFDCAQHSTKLRAEADKIHCPISGGCTVTHCCTSSTCESYTCQTQGYVLRPNYKLVSCPHKGGCDDGRCCAQTCATSTNNIVCPNGFRPNPENLICHLAGCTVAHCCAPGFLGGCVTVMSDWGHVGNNLDHFPTIFDAPTCCDKCRATSGCAVWSVYSHSGCWLHYQANLVQSSLALAAGYPTPGTCSYEDNVDYYGNDISDMIMEKATPEDCCAYCHSIPTCTCWSYWKDTKTCWPKTSIAGRGITSSLQNHPIISGYIPGANFNATPPATCSLPPTITPNTGYKTDGCPDGSTQAGCSLTCATGFSGTPSATCPAIGLFQVTGGCTVPNCVAVMSDWGHQGHDLAHFSAIFDAPTCCDKCRANPQCAVWSLWVDTGCWLHTQANPYKWYLARGGGYPIRGTCANIQQGYEHVGNVIARDANIRDANGCCSYCQSTASCTHWTVLPQDACYLHNAPNLQASSSPGAVVGQR